MESHSQCRLHEFGLFSLVQFHVGSKIFLDIFSVAYGILSCLKQKVIFFKYVRNIVPFLSDKGNSIFD
jgi:hypothetical protein